MKQQEREDLKKKLVSEIIRTKGFKTIAGTADTDAVNVSQLKEVQAQVGSGWQLAGNDGQKVADIGAGKKVSFTGSQYLTANTESAGTDAANVTYGLKTKALTAADG